MTTRRHLISSSMGVLAGAALSACGGAEAAEDKPAFVLVHGAWHGAWSYDYVIPELAALGFAAVSVDLPGHGLDARFPASYFHRPIDSAAFAVEPSPVRAVTVEQSADAVIAVIDKLREGGHSKVILVGHSMGGVTITRVAEKVPTKLSAVVYLTAFMLPDGQTVLDAAGRPENSTSEVGALYLSDPVAAGAVRIDPRSADAAYRAKCKSALYSDLTQEQFEAVLNLLTPDEPALMGVTPTVRTTANWGGVRRHFIKCLQDRTIPPALQQWFIDQADAFSPANRTIVHTLDSSHSPFVSMPAQLARALAKAA